MLLTGISAAWLFGLAFSPLAPLTVAHWLILSGASFIAFLLAAESRPAKILFGAILMFCLASARGLHYQQQHSPAGLTQYNDLSQPVSIEGLIVSYPEEREQFTRFSLKAGTIQVGSGQPSATDGLLIVNASRFIHWAYGDRIQVTGRLETPPEFEDFSYKDYLARQGIHSLLKATHGRRLEAHQANPVLAVIYRIRSQCHAVVGKLFPEPEASLLSGILLGLESGISPEIRSEFDRTGTTHIIAISGFNITIIAAIFISLGKRWLGARRGIIIAGLAILVYTVLVGADAAVLRATVMAFLGLAAGRLGRQTDGLAALAAAAILMSAITPIIITDVGFQLSFAATLGLIVYAQPLTDSLVSFVIEKGHVNPATAAGWAGPLSEYFTATLAAQLTTLPLILYHFSRISLVSPLANLLILPAQPAVMIVSGVATLAGWLWLPLGQTLAWLAWPFARYTTGMVGWLASWSAASMITPPISPLLLILCYAALALLSLKPSFAPEAKSHGRSWSIPWHWLGLMLLLGNLLLWRLLLDQPDGELHLTLLDTGAQPSLLIETPAGRRLLIDGGASSIRLGSQLDARISPFERQLDWLILTSADESMAAGIAGLIDRYSVGGALLVQPSASQALQQIGETLQESNRPLGQFQDGQRMDLGKGASLRLWHLEDGAAFELTYDRVEYLLLTGQPEGWLNRLSPIVAGRNISALLLPGSGDASLSAPDGLARLQPEVVLLSLEHGQASGLPSPSLLQALEGSTILRTDRHGWISMATDGSSLTVEAERSLDQTRSPAWPLELPLVLPGFLGQWADGAN
jgi:competence protein ComEC